MVLMCGRMDVPAAADNLSAFHTADTRYAKGGNKHYCLLIAAPTLLRLVTSYGNIWDAGVRHIVVYNLDAIAIGVLLAYIKLYKPLLMEKISNPASLLLGVAATIILNIVAGWSGSSEPSKIYASLGGFVGMNVLFFSFSALAAAFIIAPLSKVKALPYPISFIAIRISLWSYSIYLSHILIKILTDRLIQQKTLLFVLVSAVFIIVFSALNYTFFEKPMTNLRERFRKVKQ